MRQLGTMGHTHRTIGGSSNFICRCKQYGIVEVYLRFSRKSTSAFQIISTNEEATIRHTADKIYNCYKSYYTAILPSKKLTLTACKRSHLFTVFTMKQKVR